MPKHDCGVALYPPPEVGGFTATEDKPCELLKAGRSRFYQAFTAIRPSLEKQATAHIWAWLHRLEGQCIITGEEAILNASLDYMNDF